MARKLIVALCLFAPAGLAGCSGSEPEAAPDKISAQVNNSSPAAQQAGAAPPATDMPTPGEMMKGKRPGGK